MQKDSFSYFNSGDYSAAACVGAWLDAASLADSAGSWLGPLWPSQTTAIVYCITLSMFGAFFVSARSIFWLILRTPLFALHISSVC
jgi:hypothetical protein